MKRLMISLLLLLSPCVALAQANALPAAPHLLVMGHAQGRYVPDRFTVKLDISVVDKSPAAARAKVENYAKQVFSALDKYHAMPARTQASTLAVGAKSEYRDDRQVFVGTEANRDVEATFDSSDKLKGFLDAIEANAELQIRRVDVSRSDEAQLKSGLRKLAIQDSRQSARQIAASYDLKIKGVYSVSEVAPNRSYGIGSGFAEGAPPAPPPPPPPDTALRIGTIELSQDIYAVYLTAP